MEVFHNQQMKRFEIDLDGEMAVLEYNRDGKKIYLTHTEVPLAHEGRGIGSKLAFAALEYAKAQGLTVHAQCSFVASYIRRHPEYQAITWGYGK